MLLRQLQAKTRQIGGRGADTSRCTDVLDGLSFYTIRARPHDTKKKDVKMGTKCSHRHGARRRTFKCNDAVFVRDYRGPRHSWIAGTIVRRLVNTTHYIAHCRNLL
ncbi:unnamed protein product [Haemonchus placei]|uniref:Uncharacterized protein n=1 Tax=Haemonchus placei TaxID=6290 RepID=A0A0N4WJT5_HAEPC|nr:unnamed protein product [Haemonchus placei]